MDEIKITIPVGLSEQEEYLTIAKELGKKLLPANNQKLLGGYTIKSLQTKIIISRELIEKPIVLLQCYCGTVFEKSIGKILYVNYGGAKKQKRYCSDGCRNAVMELAGKRCAIKPGRLRNVFCG
jgi:hypothetical protein